jgi:hypothetical protein
MASRKRLDVVGLSKVEIVVSRPDEEKIEAILEKTGMNKKDLKCSICEEPISDLKRVRAIFPYHSALVCCDKIECLLACRDKLITVHYP